MDALKIGMLKVGDTARITALLPGDTLYRNRLISMGLIPNTEFTISRIAPLRDPVEIIVRGYALSLRKHEASMLNLELISSTSTSTKET